MSGRILIVDGIATNRIVLKTKLSDAYYDVCQAGSAQEALRMMSAQPPDLVLARDPLPDSTGAGFARALHLVAGLADMPVVLIRPGGDAADRITALTAGASDIFTEPLDETLLLARLRSLIRQSHGDRDLQPHAGTARALGFAEAQHPLRPAGRIALVSRDRAAALRLETRLNGTGRHRIRTLDPERAVNGAPGAGGRNVPDVILLMLGRDRREEDLRLLAELRAASRTHDRPVLVWLGAGAGDLAATVLDMGACDALPAATAPEEIMLRLAAQLDRKRRADRMRDQLRDGLRAAVIDPLTGLYNRRYALSYLGHLADAAPSAPDGFAVMLADLDHFKRINDRFGHAGGDAVLASVAGLLRGCLERDDLAARIGGEEFLIATPATSGTRARRIARNICRRVRNTPVRVAGCADPVHVTVSIGITLGPAEPGAARPTVETLLEQADRALYQAKASGRDTVTLSTPAAA